ncbi:MAG TPA: matrixin family metalloprotease, partial [Planctomycetota bacterium]|nr:matrixin family metalloprotease [Planctomycetota bacterium]
MKIFVLQALRGLCAVVALLAGAAAVSTTAHGFKQNQTGPGATGPILKWDPVDMPIAWEVNPTPVSGVTGSQWQATFKKSMRTWMDLPGSDLDFCIIGTTNTAVQTNDSHNVLYCDNVATIGAGILALTNYIFNGSTGQLSDTDMVFNGKDFTWSAAFADERANNPGVDTAYDLQSIMTHELGHSIGFGHSITGPGVV